MSTETPAPEAPATPTTTTPAEPTPPAQETDWKAEARKWEAQSKANKTAADELAALKVAQMTEAEKSAARLAELESTVKGYQTKEQVTAWTREISKDSDVPASALRGSTREELESHFEELKALIPGGKTPPRAPHQKTSQSDPKDDPMHEFARGLFKSGE